MDHGPIDADPRPNRTDITDDPFDPRHGTTNGYTNLNCRCADCKAANAREMKAIRNERRAAGLPDDDPRHGKDSTYQNWACRCERCTTAHAAARKAYNDTKADRDTTSINPR